MALGAGATTKFVLPQTVCAGNIHASTGIGSKAPEYSARIERVENVKDVENYLNRVDEMIERKTKKMEELSWH